MRRGGVLILLIGLILIVGAVALFLVFQPTGGGGLGGIGAQSPTSVALPSEVPEVEVVIARVDIPANTVITDVTLLDVISIPQSEFDGAENISAVSEVQGKLAVRAFSANEQILKSALVEPGLSQQIPNAEPERARDKAYPLVVNNLTGVADQITPGDFVDVVATFLINRPVSTVNRSPGVPGADGTTGPDQFTGTVVDQPLRSTKTIVQRAQVLRILRPPVDAEPTPEGGPADAAPAVDASGQPIDAATAAGAAASVTPGTWTLVLALNDQEAELVEFSIAAEARLTLVLRGAGDAAFEPTMGTTLDLLIDEFGLPLPQPLDSFVISVESQLTPQPTRTPAPTRVP